jgi:hypothetical protein
VTLKIESIQVDLLPTGSEKYFENSLCFIKKIDPFANFIGDERYIECLIGLKTRVRFSEIILRIRDYPLPVLAIKEFKIEGLHFLAKFLGKYVNVDYFEREKHYSYFDVNFNSIEVNFGLNL